MSTIKEGAIVWLRSGGPAMTVKWLDENNGGWICCWFDGKKLLDGLFSEEQLTETDPNSTGNLPIYGG